MSFLVHRGACRLSGSLSVHKNGGTAKTDKRDYLPSGPETWAGFRRTSAAPPVNGFHADGMHLKKMSDSYPGNPNVLFLFVEQLLVNQNRSLPQGNHIGSEGVVGLIIAPASGKMSNPRDQMPNDWDLVF